MRTFTATTLIATLAMSGCASAPPEQQSAATSAPTPAATQVASSAPGADPDETICKTTAVTGRRVRQKKICMTRREWAETAAIAQEGIENIERKSGYGQGGGD
jgi:hypothetical protein